MSYSRAPRRRATPRRPHAAVGLLVSLVFIGSQPGAATASPDTQAPSVSVTAPAGGATVAGAVTLRASASDNVGVSEVRWYVDGVEVARDTTAPWMRTWRSNAYSSGAHDIYARAVDAAGNWQTSVAQRVTVRSLKGWPLVMYDPFNGSSVDTTKWRIYGPWIPGHNGNGIRDGSALSVGGGRLAITAKMVNGTLVSGGMANRLDQTYGFYEFNARADADPSEAMYGVILTWPQSGNWPIDGENDIWDTLPSRNPLRSFVHYGADNKQYWFHHDAKGTTWHTVAMEWDAAAIRIYRDGVLVWTLTDAAAIPDVAHHLTIQLDAFKKSMSGSVRLEVGYVRIYDRP